MPAERVAVIGASGDRNKFGNKAVRAYSDRGDEVFPVNPHEKEIEGLKVYPSILDVPGDLDRISIYVPPDVGLTLLADIARKGAREIFLNPGAESMELLDKGYALGLSLAVACSIVDIGKSPAQYQP